MLQHHAFPIPLWGGLLTFCLSLSFSLSLSLSLSLFSFRRMIVSQKEKMDTHAFSPLTIFHTMTDSERSGPITAIREPHCLVHAGHFSSMCYAVF